MLKFRTTAFSLITLAAVLALPAIANAGCTLSFEATGIGRGSTAILDSDPFSNTCIGTDALSSNITGPSTGFENTASGSLALYSNTTGSENTASGYYALGKNTKGSANTASGNAALGKNTTGSVNSAIGYYTLFQNTTGYGNTAIGSSALSYNTTGSNNTAVGYQAGLNWTTGARNVAIGAGAGLNQTTGSNNIAIIAPGAAGDTGTIRIGKVNTHRATFIAGIRGINVTGGQAVLVNAAGQLGVASSSRRYKQDIHPMGDASNRLLELRPVTFHYKQAEEDGSRPLQYGLIAEEVAEVMPELAVYNSDGTPESVAYQVLPSLLLNEYQKQARELSEAKAKLAAVEADYKTKLEAVEAEMASMKFMLSKLANAKSGSMTVASSP
jgi:hypothetical protein